MTIAASPAAAQNTGTILGTVIDNTSQAVPAATVTLTNESTGTARAAVSDRTREFTLCALDAESYTVRVELAGFRTVERRNIVLNASGHIDLGPLKAGCRHGQHGGSGRRRRHPRAEA